MKQYKHDAIVMSKTRFYFKYGLVLWGLPMGVFAVLSQYLIGYIRDEKPTVTFAVLIISNIGLFVLTLSIGFFLGGPLFRYVLLRNRSEFEKK